MLGRQCAWLVALISIGCSTRSVVDADNAGGAAGGGSAGQAGAASGGAGNVGGAAGSAGTGALSGTGGVAGAGATTSVTVAIASDDDDVMWHWTPSGGWLEKREAGSVSNVLHIREDPSKVRQSAGLRFKLDIPADAKLLGADLALSGYAHNDDPMKTGDTLEVRRFDPEVPFAPGAHAHAPKDHSDLSATGVVFPIEMIGKIDVRTLVQPALSSLVGWQAGSFVAFHVAAKDAETRGFSLGDKGKNSPDSAVLHLTFTP